MTTANDAINAFLDKFNYTHKDGEKAGKRAGMKFWFFNNELTGQLEKQANDLARELTSIRDSEKSDAEKTRDFLASVDSHIDNAWDARSKLSPTVHRTEALNYDMHTTLPPTMIEEYDYHRAYTAGKFEKEILSGLKASAKLLEGDEKNQLDTLANKVKSYDPTATITNRRVNRI